MYRKNIKRLELHLAADQNRSFNGNTSLHDTTKEESMQHNLYQKGPACILPNLYLGAHYNTLNTHQLKKIGINCIINVASEIKQTKTPIRGIHYHHLGWTHCQSNLAVSEFDNAIQKITHAHDNNQIVLIHCQQGVERSATLVLAYLLYCRRKEIGWSLDKAMSVVKEKAPGIRPNMELLYQLREYEQALHLNTSTQNSDGTRTRSKSITFSSSEPPKKLISLPTSQSAIRRSASFRDITSSNEFMKTATVKKKQAIEEEQQALAITSLLVLLIAISKKKLLCNELHYIPFNYTNKL